MKKRTFSAKQKASIVLEVLKQEHSALDIARNHNLAPSLLYKWRDQFLANADKAFDQSADQTQAKKIRKYEHVITKLTTQNDFLEKVLRTLD